MNSLSLNASSYYLHVVISIILYINISSAIYFFFMLFHILLNCYNLIVLIFLTFLFILVLVCCQFVFCFFLRQDHTVQQWLAWNLLYKPDWTQTHRDPLTDPSAEIQGVSHHMQPLYFLFNSFFLGSLFFLLKDILQQRIVAFNFLNFVLSENALMEALYLQKYFIKYLIFSHTYCVLYICICVCMCTHKIHTNISTANDYWHCHYQIKHRN